MELKNYTPFPSIAWENVDANNTWYATFVSKVKLDIKIQNDSELKLQLSQDQGELNFSDVFNGKEWESSVRYESDLVTYKKNTDVILNARAYSPLGEKRRSWHCGIKIFEPNGDLIKDYALTVKGERKFTKKAGIWVPHLKTNVTSVPIRYEKAYGGTIKTKKDKIIKTKVYNPVGCGIRKTRDASNLAYSPQINYLHRKFTRIPAGFGFIGRTWKNRLKYVGTYDQNWLDNQHPLPPHDFDYLYNQAAHPELVMDGYIQPQTTIELYNLTKHKRKVYFKLPKYELIARLQFHTGEIFQKMDLDTLVIDIDHENETQNCIYASYRTRIEKIHKIIGSQIMLLQDKEKNG